MALDQKRRQKKLARKAAKRKKALAGKRREIPGQRNSFALAAGMPIHECLVPRDLRDKGIGNVAISRKMPNGDIALAMFLVDVYCLGVKNCLFAVISQEEYAQKMGPFARDEGFKHTEPACVVKLIKDAVAYAEGLGFRPHRDYLTAKGIFGSIDPAACSREFEFGKDGKPFYIAGPNETQADSERIIATLTRKLGSDGFNHLLGVDLGEA